MPALLAEDLLNQMIPPLKSSDTTAQAARWLEEFHVNQLPVLAGSRYRGLITENDLADYENPDTQLADLALGFANVHVQHDQHFYRVMELAIENKLQLIPVLDEHQDYAGVVTVNDALAAFGPVPGPSGQGSILVLTMEERDYSLSQISRYIEENNAKVLSAHVVADEHDPYRIRLTLRLNTDNLARITATLERFGYMVTAQFSGTAAVGDDEQERFDALLRYLSV